MKTSTAHTITLSISEIEHLLSVARRNQMQHNDLGQTVTIPLDFDSDMMSHRLTDAEMTALHHSAYAECHGLRFSATTRSNYSK